MIAAQIAEGLAGAELENIVNLAALQSVRKAQSFKANNEGANSMPLLGGKDLIAFVKEFMEEKKKLKNANPVG